MTPRTTLRSTVCLAAVALVTPALAQAESPNRPADQKGYEVHDMSRPQPQRIDPGTASTQDRVGTAPSDAVVLFDGKDLSKWKSGDGNAAKWEVKDGYFHVAKGGGNIATRDSFGDCQLHIEWQSPESDRSGQARANSGVFLMGLYEVQILDTFENKTYPDGMAGSLYGQYPPLVNAARAAGQWQTYDIIFHPARMEKDGKTVRPATFTVLFNGVLVQDNAPAIGPTRHKELARYGTDLPEKGPIQLQDHGDPVKFRNIWVRAISPKDQQPDPAVRPAGAGH